MPGSTVLHYLPEFAETHVHWVNDDIQLSPPLLPPSLPALNLSQHQVFSNELALWNRWPKYWSFSFGMSPSNKYSRLISFRIDWFALLAVQVTLKSLFQHHSSKVSIPQCLAFFIAQLSHLYKATGKIITLTIWTFVGKVISLFFNTLSRASLIAQSVKNLPTMQETQVRFLGLEDSLEKEMAINSSILAWRIPWIEELGKLLSMRSQESDMTYWLNHHHVCHSFSSNCF